jgi:hypothetical protein
MGKNTIHNTQARCETVEVVPAASARETLARGAILFGSACLAVGGAIGYALGVLDTARQRKGGNSDEV